MAKAPTTATLLRPTLASPSSGPTPLPGVGLRHGSGATNVMHVTPQWIFGQAFGPDA